MNAPKNKRLKQRTRLPSLKTTEALNAFKAQVDALPTIGRLAKQTVMASITAAMNEEPETAENVVKTLDPEDQLRVMSAAMSYQRTFGTVASRGAALMMTIPESEFENDD